MTATLDAILARLDGLRREHGGEFCQHVNGGPCNCGASAHNAALDALKADLRAALQPRALESIIHVDATPDADYPARILRAHLEANTSCVLTGNSPDGSAERVAEVINAASRERASLLRSTLAALQPFPAELVATAIETENLRAQLNYSALPPIVGRLHELSLVLARAILGRKP